MDKKINAKESIKEDGKIVIRATRFPSQIIIADNGPGIENEHKAKIFTPFFSTKPTGQGVGLTLIRDILTQHQAGFRLETEEDGWTRFRIAFLSPIA